MWVIITLVLLVAYLGLVAVAPHVSYRLRARAPVVSHVVSLLWNAVLCGLHVHVTLAAVPHVVQALLPCAWQVSAVQAHAFWAVKVTALGDTALLMFVVAGRVRVVHWVHHSVTLAFTTLSIAVEWPLATALALLNAVVCAFYYAYFCQCAVAALWGPWCKPTWGPALSRVQLAEMGVGAALALAWLVVARTRCVALVCDTPCTLVTLLAIAMYGVFYALIHRATQRIQ